MTSLCESQTTNEHIKLESVTRRLTGFKSASVRAIQEERRVRSQDANIGGLSSHESTVNKAPYVVKCTGCCISSHFVQICNPGLVEILDILGTSG